MDQPIVLTTKTLLALLLAVAILSGGVAVAAAQLSQPGSATAQRATGETRELKELNRRLGKANRTLTGIQGAIGTEPDAAAPTLRRNTRDTADKVQKLCVAVAEFASDC